MIHALGLSRHQWRSLHLQGGLILTASSVHPICSCSEHILYIRTRICILSKTIHGRSFGGDSVGIIDDVEVDTCEDLLGGGRGRGCVLLQHKHNIDKWWGGDDVGVQRTVDSFTNVTCKRPMYLPMERP